MVVDFTELDDKKKEITTHLKRDLRFTISYCSVCNSPAPHERRLTKVVRDLPIAEYDSYLCCELFMVKCKTCGCVRERLDFIDRCSRFKIRLETCIFKLVNMSTIKDVADKFSFVLGNI